MILKKEDKLYHEANNIFRKCSKTCVTKISDHCHETGKQRGYACNICNLNYGQQNFIPVIFHDGKGYDLHVLLMRYLNRMEVNRMGVIDGLPSFNGIARVIRVGVLKFIDSSSFMTMSRDKSANVYGIKSKT